MGIVEETQVRLMVKGMVITDFWRILLSYFMFCLRKIPQFPFASATPKKYLISP